MDQWSTRQKEQMERVDLIHWREQEPRLLHALLDHLPDYIYFKDLSSRFTLISRSLAERLGLSVSSEAIGKSDFDFFPTEYARRAREDERRIIRTGEPIVDREERGVWPDGREVWVLTNKIPLRDESGQIIGTCGISHDIAQLKHQEEALRQAKAAAEIARRLMGEAMEKAMRDRQGLRG
jgi:two-component system, sensor histidine kinase and response regulator